MKTMKLKAHSNRYHYMKKRVKKMKQVIATGDALLRFTETLPHHAYHKICQKIGDKVYLSTTLATTDLTGINYYRQRRPPLYSGRKKHPRKENCYDVRR